MGVRKNEQSRESRKLWLLADLAGTLRFSHAPQSRSATSAKCSSSASPPAHLSSTFTMAQKQPLQIPQGAPGLGPQLPPGQNLTPQQKQQIQQQLQQQQQQQQQIAASQVDPVMQQRIADSHIPVDLILGDPNNVTAHCAPHKLEKCDECGLDFVHINRLSRVLAANPNILCPPPPQVVNQKLSVAINATKEEGNVRLFVPQPFTPKFLFHPFRGITRPSSEHANPKRLSRSTPKPLHTPYSVHHGSINSTCAKNSPPCSQTVPPHSSRVVTSSPLLPMPRQSFRSRGHGRRDISERRGL